ncbi:hypothetical protein [Nocardioides sp. KR10-350]|uniref:hypothetical protein n=1 Tax=Nocardioides cheoyonin TaxID=3156615 RepID=UPI0032B5D756
MPEQIVTWPSPSWSRIAAYPCERHDAVSGDPCWGAVAESAAGGSGLCGARMRAAGFPAVAVHSTRRETT